MQHNVDLTEEVEMWKRNTLVNKQRNLIIKKVHLIKEWEANLSKEMWKPSQTFQSFRLQPDYVGSVKIRSHRKIVLR